MGGYRSQAKEFALYPKFRANYVRAFDRMLVARKEAGLSNNVQWTDGESVMKWWTGENVNQIRLEDIYDL